ncbi:MAG: hypothetical protein ACK4Z9_07970 [Thermodesulfovibrionales bacterium]
MEKTEFLTRVAEVMKSMVSYEAMMESLRRSCLRSEAENLDLLMREETKVDRLVEESNGVDEIKASEDTFDALILRYLKNTQFLSCIEEEYIDISGLDNDIAFWKKTMLYRAP